MFAILRALRMFVVDMIKSWGRLEVENLFFRHQLRILCGGHHLGFDFAEVTGAAHMDDTVLAEPTRFSRRRSCGGNALASERSGVGNREIGLGGRRSIVVRVI
jgi:hypothetical protein